MSYSGRTLSEGCRGKVRMGWYKGLSAAIKIVPHDQTDEDDLRRECRVYAKLNHKNVVKLLGPPEKHNDGWHIPLAFILGRTLDELIFLSGVKLSAADKDLIITGMCEGLNYLHDNDIVHQDLKPDSIMIEHSTKQAVIIDLGLPKFIGYTKGGSPFSSGKNKGFRQYAAPEARAGRIRSRKSDVWSLGKVVAETILGNRLKWDDCSAEDVCKLLRGSKYADIVRRMLHENRRQRVAMKEVLKNVQDINATGPPTQVAVASLVVVFVVFTTMVILKTALHVMIYFSN